MNWIENNFNSNRRSPLAGVVFQDTHRLNYTNESFLNVRTKLDFMSVESYSVEREIPNYLQRSRANERVEMCSTSHTTGNSVSTSMRPIRYLVDPALRGADIACRPKR